MSLSKQFQTDKSLEKKGVGIQFPANEDGSVPEFFLCRVHRSNPEFQRVNERTWKPHRRAMSLGALPQAKQDDLTMAVFAEAGCVGWKNVLKADVTGDAADTGYAEYSVENAVKLFKNLPDLYDSLYLLATERSTFQQGELEEDAKNSSKSSATSSSKGQ